MVDKRRNKPAPFPTGIRPEPKLNTFQKHELTQKAVEAILAGKPRREILEIIELNMPVQLSKTGMENIYGFAHQWLQENVMLDAKTIISIHRLHYEHIQQFFISIGDIKGANRAKYSIERLMGMHREKVVAKVNKKTNINVMKKQEYDITKLSPQERERFQFLIKKSTQQATEKVIQS